ncbi:tetratricopeptide repeat protein, partial [Methylocucumis oryzae]|uniref:tetratricopeptide repeat protein n=1 Tax=Methylocucumis oryzae TaxID=1632867 RepID=UPI00103FE859
MYEGAVTFFNPQGKVRLMPGQGAQAEVNQKPTMQITLSPSDAVSWALYYPPLFSDAWLTGANQMILQRAAQAFHHGRSDEALFMLDAIPTAQQSIEFLKLRAAMLLSVGRVQLALHAIHQVLTQQPNDAEALALQAIIALSQNNKDQAYRLAQQAVTLNPTAAIAYTALSYVEQSRFNLVPALKAAQQASQNAQGDAMVWARQSELELCLGLLSESAHSAQQALTLDAGLARTQTVMGFSYLLRTDLTAAKQSFNEAIHLDSASPLARLGLGLTKIRTGDVAEGRKDLEIAAILDPQNSLLRSYLGKAYYEEKRNALAQEQFSLAKQLDPNDPTPYFYDAIAKQTSNRTIAALHDIEQAKSLNANRAVYRSQLMLDKDLAARSAAQGRIYHDLGFQRLSLLEGWQSIATDPANYSAHRLLADSYASQPRHEIARVSELLQAQLLQPLNMTPIQPQLAQSNILIIDGLGPSALAFNEYNPLFTRNRHAVQSSAIYGSNNTFGDDAVYSGLWNQLSYSLGQYHYETDGFRANNSVNQNIYNAFVQANISDSLNLQFEYRYETRDNGDLSIPFFPENFSSFYQEHTDITSYRLGGRYAFNTASSLLGS